MAGTAKKENIFLRIVKYLIPWKGDRPGEIIRKIIFFAALIILIVSLASIFGDTKEKIEDTQLNNQLSEIFHNGYTGENTTINLDPVKIEQLKTENPEVLEKFLPLLDINPDVVGWITLGDPEDPFIDYVVVQGEDNDYYLTHNYRKEESRSGAIFADYREPLAADGSPANTILFGHNMLSGEYFAKLTRYFNYRPGNSGAEAGNIDFYKKYPTLKFSTLYKDSTYKIFAGMLVNTEESEGEVFYYLNGRNFSSKKAFNDYVANVLDRSTFYTDVDLEYGDKLLTLSTCDLDYDYGNSKNLRWVLYAREVRDGEDPSVDVSKAYANPDPLYFDYYYSIYGGEWGGRKWPETMINGYSHSNG